LTAAMKFLNIVIVALVLTACLTLQAGNIQI
jgi:hypothetical protein